MSSATASTAKGGAPTRKAAARRGVARAEPQPGQDVGAMLRALRTDGEALAARVKQLLARYS